jgi:hypothetical protein
VKNQSFYAVVLTLLVLITVAMWQFFSLVARGEGLHEPYTAKSGEDRAFKRPTLATSPK